MSRYGSVSLTPIVPLTRVTRFGLVDAMTDSCEIMRGVRVRVARGELISYLIHVPSRPSFSNGKMNGNVATLHIPPTPRSVLSSPPIVQSPMKCIVVGLVAIAPSGHTLNGIGPGAAFIAQVKGEKPIGCG